MRSALPAWWPRRITKLDAPREGLRHCVHPHESLKRLFSSTTRSIGLCPVHQVSHYGTHNVPEPPYRALDAPGRRHVAGQHLKLPAQARIREPARERAGFREALASELLQARLEAEPREVEERPT